MMRNVGRVDRAAALVRPENLEAIVERFERVLGIRFDGPIVRTAADLRMYVVMDAGIELLAPLSDDLSSPSHRLLEDRGEHWMSVAFGVPDLDAACDQLAKLGYKPRTRNSGFDPKLYRARVTRLETAVFDKDAFGGLKVVFSVTEQRGSE